MRVQLRGVALNVEADGQGPPLLLLHGFTGSVATWGRPPALAAGFRTLAVDLLGHGASDDPAEPGRYALWEGARDLHALLDALGVGRAGILGYSLGGRLALHAALLAPERIAALVLEGANPGLAVAAERTARAAADGELAARLEREGIGPFVARWERQPIFATQERLPEARRAALRAQRLANRPGALAASLRGMGLATQDDLLPRLGEIGAPTLLVTGALDAKFGDLAARMAAVLPRARVARIAGAGHAAHFEAPAAFLATVRGFLDQCVQEGAERRWR